MHIITSSPQIMNFIPECVCNDWSRSTVWHHLQNRHPCPHVFKAVSFFQILLFLSGEILKFSLATIFAEKLGLGESLCKWIMCHHAIGYMNWERSLWCLIAAHCTFAFVKAWACNRSNYYIPCHALYCKWRPEVSQKKTWEWAVWSAFHLAV